MYAVEFLNALKDKGLEGLFVNDYFTTDKASNIMQFSSGAVNATANSMSFTVVRNEKQDGVKGVKARQFGANYDGAVNSTPVPETFYLGVFGGLYSIDKTLDDINKKIFTENEARAKMTDAVEEFNRQLIAGSGLDGEFVGMRKYCKDKKLEAKTTGECPEVISEADALAFLGWFNKLRGMLNVDANAIFCSRDMAANLETIQAILNRPTVQILVNKLGYETFLNIPIVPLPNTVISEYTALESDEGLEVGAKYQELYLARIDLNKGVFCGSPADRTAFVKVQKPVANGTPLETGYVDFATCFVPKNRKALIKGYVKTANA